jgi:hypothetical protein
MTDEKEDLEALLRSTGWLRFARHIEQEWGDKFHTHVTAAVGDSDDVIALQKLRQITVAKREIEKAMRWPSDRIAELTRSAESQERAHTVPLSRRGHL